MAGLLNIYGEIIMLHYIDEEPGNEVGNLIQGMPFKEYLNLEKYIHSSDIKKLDQSISLVKF